MKQFLARWFPRLRVRWFGPRVLFVCTGNTCRSPMAEYLTRKWFRVAAVRSAGTSAHDGDRMTFEAVQYLAHQHGVDGRDHRSHRLTAGMVKWADVVICMTEQHAATVTKLGGGKKVQVLSVSDPFGGDAARYADAAGQIADGIRNRGILTMKGGR